MNKFAKVKNRIWEIGVTLSLVLVGILCFTFFSSGMVSAATPPPSVKRTLAMQYMDKMAKVTWIPSTNLVISNSPAIPTKTYTAGITYKGIPYSQYYNFNYSQFVAQLSNGYLSNNCVGIDCSTAVIFSWQNSGVNISDGNTGDMRTRAKTNSSGCIKVGTYTFGTYTTSRDICDHMLTNSNSYNYLVAGDSLVSDNHAILVTSVTKSNGITTGIVFEDQCGNYGANIWGIGSTYTVTQLKTKGFIPITAAY